MKREFQNILIVAGSGRNVGKTTFLCRLIQANQHLNLTAIKITPHFHSPTVGLKLLREEENYRIYEETNSLTDKDSSKYLQAGANKSYVINAGDNSLSAAFSQMMKYLAGEPVVIESASLAKIIRPSLFLIIQKENEEIKESSKQVISLADQVISSSGTEFKIEAETILFDKNWKFKNHDYAETGS